MSGPSTSNHATIIAQFHHWREHTYAGQPMDPAGEQYKQLRGAFYAGAASMYLNLTELGRAGQARALASFDRYETEIRGFLDSEKADFNKRK